MSDTPNVGAPAPAAPAAEPNTAPAGDKTPELSAEDAEFEAVMAPLRAERKALKEKEEAERDAGGEKEPEGEKTDDELKAEAEEKAKKDAAKKEPKVKTYKINGKEVKVDVSDEAKVDRLIAEGLSATEKFHRASKIEKGAENLVNALKDTSRLFQVLEHPHLVGDRKAVRQAAEKYLYDLMQEDALTPDERARLQEKNELDRLRQEKEERKQAAETARREKMKEDLRQDYTKKFMEVLDKSDLPVNDWTLTKMAAYMRQAIKKGYKNIGPADVVEFVQRDWKQVYGQLHAKKTGADLVKTLGDDVVQRIRQHDVETFKAGRQNAAPSRAPNGQFERSERPAKTYNSAEEMADAIRNRR